MGHDVAKAVFGSCKGVQSTLYTRLSLGEAVQTPERGQNKNSLPRFRSNMSSISKGGVITLSSGEDWENIPGPTVILRNSTFESNTADLGNAGVVYLGEFSSLIVAGDGNVFSDNTCGEEGGVLGGTTNTNITVEGGVFKNNVAQAVGGCVSFFKTVLFCIICLRLLFYCLNDIIPCAGVCD